MGAYLPKPVKEKISADGSEDHVDFGASGMQGWRVSMEDAHCCLPNVDGKGNCLFGVFDGHGGNEVAEYCALNIDKFLLDTEAYSEGKMEKALKETFMNIDDALTSEEVIEELKELGGVKDNEEEQVNEAAMLLEEAEMPIGELLERLKENVKERLAGSGILKESEDEDEEQQEEKGEKQEEKDGTQEEKETLVNGHTEKAKDSQLDSGRSRKQKKPVKRTEDASNDNNITSGGPPGDDSGSGGAGESGSSSGCSSLGGSGSGGSSKYALEDNEEDPDYKEDPDDDDDDEEEDEESDDEDEESDDEDDEDDDDDNDEFQDGEDVEFEQGFVGEVGKGSGTTAVVALIYNSKLYVANSGDSRCVLCRNGSAVEMSLDHTPQLESEKKRIEAAGGKITADGRVNGGLNLSRAIGDHVYKENKDLPPEDQAITAMPDVKETQLTKDDSFMVLACDGIWNVMTSEQVIDFVKERLDKNDEKSKLSKICEEMFDHCIAPDKNNDEIGCDNMTCVIVRFKHDENGNIKGKGQMKRAIGSDGDDAVESNKKSKKAKLS